MKLPVLVLVALAACTPYLTQQSVAPPGRSARLDEVKGFWGLERYRLEISEGVALALTCYRGGPCEKTSVTSDNPAIAEVRPASLAALQPAGHAGFAPASAFVVVGKARGTTTLRVTAKEGSRIVTVTVIAPPAPASTQAAAR